jgi:hypothetical protein
MQPITTMLRRSGHHVSRQRDLFALRAKKAGSTFAVETRDAGRDLATAVRAEANAWAKYVVETSRGIAPVSIERNILVRIGGTLRALESRVQKRLHSLNGTKRVRSPKAKRPRRASH